MQNVVYGSSIHYEVVANKRDLAILVKIITHECSQNSLVVIPRYTANFLLPDELRFIQIKTYFTTITKRVNTT
mgnify:CR=1 FL=1